MLIVREGTNLETIYVRRWKDNGGRSGLTTQSIHTERGGEGQGGRVTTVS